MGISEREYEIFCDIIIAAYSSYCLPQPLRIRCQHAGKTLLPGSVRIEETNAILCTLMTARKKPIVSDIMSELNVHGIVFIIIIIICYR